MNTYETTATVEAQGQVRVAGVPFAPGTEVERSALHHPDQANSKNQEPNSKTTCFLEFGSWNLVLLPQATSQRIPSLPAGLQRTGG